MSESSSAKRRIGLDKLSRILGLTILIIGILVIFGWLFNLSILTQIHPSLASMKFNTALLFSLGGMAIFFNESEKIYIKPLPWIIMLVASFTLGEYLFAWDFGIDQFFVKDLQASELPGRMSAVTAINFILAAVSLLTLEANPQLSQLSATLLAITALIALAGYIYAVPALYHVFIFSTVALHTAIAFLVLAIALILANKHSQFIQIIISDTAGGRLLRQVLPLTLSLLIVLNLVFTLGENFGLYPTQFIWPLNIISNIAILIAVIHRIARNWHETDLQRLDAETKVKQVNESLQELVEQRTTALMQTMQSLEQSQQRFSAMLANAHDAIISINEQERIILFNRGAETIFGYSQEAIIGQPIQLLIPERFRPSHSQHIANFAQSEAESRIMASNRPKLLALHRDGHEFFVDVSIAQVKLASERILTAIIRDVSVQKAAEEKMLIYKSAVEESHDLIVVVDRAYRYLITNQSHLKYNQREREDVIGRHVSEIVGKEIFDKQLNEFYDRCFAGETVNFESDAVYPLLGLRHLLVNYSPLRDSTNQVIAAIVIIHDITERKLVELQSRQLEIERERVKIYQDFIQAASHDLRTPITHIMTTLYLMRRKTDNAEQINRILKLESDTKHLGSIVEALLQMSELNAKVDFQFRPLELKGIVTDVMTALLAKAERKKQQFRADCPSEHFSVNGDALHLYQALYNIVQNALDFTGEDGSITVACYRQEDEIVIEISDTGIGIDETDLPHIFEPFYRADKARSTTEGHSGMGLAIAQKIIHVHQGRIEVESQINRGSHFRIFLRAADYNDSSDSKILYN